MKAHPYKVLYLNHAAKPSGAEFALKRMIEAIDREKVLPRILFGEEGCAVDFMREIGVDAEVLPLTGKIREVRKGTLGLGAIVHPGRLVMMSAYALRIAAFARRHGIQIIHTNTIKAHVYGVLAGHLAGIPVVWHLRDYVNESYFPRAAVRLIRFLARWAPKHIIGVSRSVMGELQLGDDDHRSSVILDGLTDRELSVKIRSRPWPQSGTPVRIGIAGRLAPWKGQHICIEAVAKVIAAGFNVELAIIGAPLFGEEDYEAELRRQAESLGLGDRVHFLGFTRDVLAELCKLDVFVHASISSEPFGQVIVEAMSIGLPVVASLGGGATEIVIHGQNGMLTRMGDADALKDALLLLLEAPDWAQCLGRAGYMHVRKHFRVERTARQVENVYHSVMASAS